MARISSGEKAPRKITVVCTRCGEDAHVPKGKTVPPCRSCGNGEFTY